MNVNEAQYWGLSNLIYKDSVLAVNTKFTNPEDNSKWVTVSSVNNSSGLQAAAVVPLSEWEAQKNKNPKKLTRLWSLLVDQKVTMLSMWFKIG